MAVQGLNNGYKVESNGWLYKGLIMDTRWGAMDGWTRAKQWIQGGEQWVAVQGLNNGYKFESDVWLDQGLTMDTSWRAMYGCTRD